MSDSYEIENNAIDGEDSMGSLNHSTVQISLGGLLKFKCNKQLAVMSELSLDISQYDLSEFDLGVKEEFKPDICAYFKQPVVPKGKSDLIRVSQMPELAIEILSPRQAVDYLIRKIHAYFKLGVKSCWLVMPSLNEVKIYSKPDKSKNFDMNQNEIIDEVMGIHLPFAPIFGN